MLSRQIARLAQPPLQPGLRRTNGLGSYTVSRPAQHRCKGSSSPAYKPSRAPTPPRRTSPRPPARPEGKQPSGGRPWKLPDLPWKNIAIGLCAALTLFNVGRAMLGGTQDDSEDGAAASQDPRAGYASRILMLEAASKLADLLGEDKVSFDDDVLEHHGRSDWSTANTSERAVAVAYPTSTTDVQIIAKICTKYKIPMIPFGAGSSVEGNFSQPLSGICIDFTHMDKIVAFHPDDMDVVVQPGVNWMGLNEKIADSGLFFPMDPSPTATFGGMVSTNCSGTNAMRYGTMKDWVINLTVVLPDGNVIKTRRRPRKTSAGYNLTSLFVGAEGTLGIVTEMTLKLAPIPEDTSVAVVSFSDITTAAKAASALIRSGIQLGALEMMDDVQMQLLNKHGSETVRKRTWAEQPTLFIKFSGTTDGIKSDIKRVNDIVKKVAGSKIPFQFARTKQDEHDLWAARKEALFTMVATRPPGTVLWSTDVAVPLSRLAEIIEISKKECGSLGIFATVIGHVGDGNFHVAMMYNPHDKELTEKVSKVVHNMMDRALDMEGTVSGEHAIGIGKKNCLMDELGAGTIGLMQTFKKSVDPLWIMNPGKVFDRPGSAKSPVAGKQ